MSKDAAYGALLGALCGDAAGGVLEFMGRLPDHEEVEAALRMPGGGVWELGPGQITDDTELALCLTQALVPHTPRACADGLPLDDIAFWYGRWIDSPPFDIGNTCRASMPAARGLTEPRPGVASAMMAAAQRHSLKSKANGALMRVMPLAVWAHRLDDAHIAAFAAQEASLSHPNFVCQDASAAYCIALAHLIREPGDAEGALARAEAWLEENGSEAVQSWYRDTLGAVPVVSEAAGFVKWAFILTFKHLRQRSTYLDAMAHVLSLGGDVDTNAAIVGGMIGALNGAAGIPRFMSEPVLKRNVGAPGRPRPAYLQSGQLPRLFEELWATATAGPEAC